jgi:purine-binding chemotaxis protein CheW
MMSNYLIFELAGRLFGAKLVGAIEILPWRRSRSVPLSQDYVEGLIDYRGTVYPVFNLAQRLGLSMPGPIGFTAEKKEAAGAGQSIILLEESKMPFGIVVDGVAKMAALEEATTAVGKAHGIDQRYVRGITFENDHEIMILDFERLFHAD